MTKPRPAHCAICGAIGASELCLICHATGFTRAEARAAAAKREERVARVLAQRRGTCGRWTRSPK